MLRRVEARRRPLTATAGKRRKTRIAHSLAGRGSGLGEASSFYSMCIQIRELENNGN
jgi:hypothetical protein